MIEISNAWVSKCFSTTVVTEVIAKGMNLAVGLSTSPGRPWTYIPNEPQAWLNTLLRK